MKKNWPARGLIFGPVRGEEEFSTSGKRLRVEQRNLGRPGGVFATGSASGNGNKSLGDGSVDLVHQVDPTLQESGGQTNVVMHMTPTTQSAEASA